MILMIDREIVIVTQTRNLDTAESPVPVLSHDPTRQLFSRNVPLHFLTRRVTVESPAIQSTFVTVYQYIYSTLG